MNDVPPDYAGHTPADPPVVPAPPCAQDLAEVGDDQAAAHLDELGDEAAQPQDHPYDRDGDPDAEPKPQTTGGGDPSEAGAGLPSPVTSSAGTSGQLSGTLSTDGDRPWTPSGR